MVPQLLVLRTQELYCSIASLLLFFSVGMMKSERQRSMEETSLS